MYMGSGDRQWPRVIHKAHLHVKGFADTGFVEASSKTGRLSGGANNNVQVNTIDSTCWIVTARRHYSVQYELGLHDN